MPMRKTDDRRPSRRRTAGADKRAPFAETVPRPVKRAAGRTGASLVPAAIRVTGVNLEPEHRDYIRKRLGSKLGKYATSVERVSVRVRDVNGPRGGVDLQCRIKVVLSALPSIVVTQQAATLEAAVNGALQSVERAVRRGVQRRRTKPMKRAAANR